MTIELASGEKILVRPVRLEDEPLVAEAFRTASADTLLHRFFTPWPEVPAVQLRRLLTIDPTRESCVVGELTLPAGKRIVCGARYARLTDPAVAEIALTVHDEFQGKGLGAFLLRELVRLGRADGIRTFVADVLATNTRMLQLLDTLAPGHRSTLAEGVCHVEFDLADAIAPASPLAGEE